MATQGSNELNMLLKAKVVKIRAELDIKGSLPKIKDQIDDISKKLVNKPVKLKVKLEFTVKDLNSQLSQIMTKMHESKTAKMPIKIAVEIDVKGSASQIKKQLKEVHDTVQDFNKKYAKQIQQMNQILNQPQKGSKGGSPVPSQFNSASLANGVKDAKAYMRQVYGKGLFTSVELKDAEGNIKGFVGTLTKANGVIQKIQYDWNKDAGAFAPINRQTITETEKNVHKAKMALKALYADIEKLSNGAGKNSLFGSFNNLEAKSIISMDDVKKLQTMIKEEGVLQSQIKQSNNELLSQKKLIHEITKARNADWKATGDINKRKEYSSLLRDVKTNPQNLKEQAFQLKQLSDLTRDNARAEKEQLNITKQRMKVLQELRGIERKTVSTDETSNRLIQEIKLMAQRAKSGKEWIAISQKMHNLKSSNANDKEMQKSLDVQFKLTQKFKELANLGRLTSKQLEKALAEIPITAQRSFADLERQLHTVDRRLKTVRASMKDTANQSKLIFAGNGQQGKSLKALVGSGDINALQRYFGEMYKGKVQQMAMVETTDKLGRAVTEMKIKMAGAGKQVQTYTVQMERATGALRQTAQGMDYNANRNLGVMEQLKIAMARVPVWMVAMTAFYGTINSVKNMTTEILKLDKALTELRRVASDSLSIDNVFEGAVGLSKELGNNVHDVMQAVNDLARTFGHMNERQLLSITKTAVLMSNVSDLTAQEATNNLVGTMNAFNISAEESIHIVDALNEVDNDYAISTKQLSEGLAKSASTAKTFGVTMEENVGHITAIGAVTMESGAIIGNSLKTIYSRLTTMDEAKTMLQSVGVEMKDQAGDARDVADILGDLAGRWHELSKSERQNIAVKVAGRYQLSRFLALMNNFQMAQDATNSAIYSEGSAMRENAEYLKSFEARINSLKNAWTEFADRMGKALLSDGLMGAIALLGKLAEAGVWVVEKLGALPVVFGIIAGVALKFGVFAKLTGQILAFGKAYKLAMAGATIGPAVAGRLHAIRLAWAGVAGAEASATVGARAWGVAMKSAIIGTGIGAVIVALGFAIEKTVKHFANQKRKQEELEKLNKKMVDGYRKHRDGMDGMINRYEELRTKTNKTKEEQAEFNRIQKEFAENIPTTVRYVDANGKAHMKTTAEIRKEVEAVKQLSMENAKLAGLKMEEKMEKQAKSYEDITKKIKDLAKERKKLEEAPDKEVVMTGYGEGQQAQMVDNTEKNKKAIQQNKIETLMAEAEKTEALKKTIKTLQSQTLAYFEANGMMDALGDNQQSLIEKFISMNESILRSADNSKEAQLGLVEMGKQVGQVFVDAYDVLKTEIDPKNSMKLGELKEELNAIAKTVPETFFALTDEQGKMVKTSGEVVDGLKEIVNVSHEMQSAGGESTDSLIYRLQRAGLTAEQAQGYLFKLANEHDNLAIKTELASRGVNDMTGDIADLNEAVIEAIDLTKTLFGYSGSELEGLKSHIQAMHLLVDAKGEDAKASAEYIASQEAVSDFLGVTATELETNKDKYYNIIEALGNLKLSEYDMGMDWKTFIQESELTPDQKKILMGWNGTKDIITGAVREVAQEVKPPTEEVKSTIESVFTNLNLKMPEVDMTTIKVSKAYVEQDMNDIKGTVDNLMGKLGEFGLKVGTPTGVALFDNLFSQLDMTDGKVDATEQNVHIFRALINTAVDNPAMLNGLNLGLDTTGGKIDTASGKVDQFGNKLATPKSVVFLDQANQGIETTSGKLDGLGTKWSTTSTLFSNPLSVNMTPLEKYNGLMDATYGKAQTAQGAVGDVVSTGSQVSGVNQDINIVIQQAENAKSHIEDLNTSLGGFGSGFSTGAVREEIGKIGTKLDSVKTKVELFGRTLSGLAGLTIGGLANYITALGQLSHSLVLATKYGNATAQAQQAIISAFAQVTATASVYNATLMNIGTSVGVSFSIMAQAVGNAIATMIGYYGINVQAMMAMANISRQAVMAIIINFTILSALVGARIANTTNIMNTAFQNGINTLVAKASGLPARVASAIRANLHYVSSAMKAMANIVANTKMPTPRIPTPQRAGGYQGYANGGFIDKMELAWHGEEGAEAIIPLISKRRKRGLELWEETGEKLGIDMSLIDLLKERKKRKSSGGTSYAGGGSASAMSGEGGSVGGGGDSGTSGTIVSSTPTFVGGLNLDGNYEAYALEKEDLFKPNYNEREMTVYGGIINQLEGKMDRITKNTLAYRNAIKEVIFWNNKNLAVAQKELKATESRNAYVNKRLKQLGNTSKHTEAQRKEYNSLQQEYDSNLSKIASLKQEVESVTNDIRAKGIEIFTDMVDEVVAKYDTAIESLKNKVDNIDFKLEVLELTNSDDVAQKMTLLVEKSKELNKQLSYEQGKKEDLSKRYTDAVKKFGATSEQAKKLKEELAGAEEAWEDATIAVLQNEKAIRDSRGEVADESIKQLKDYYGNMKDMANKAYDEQKKLMEEEHKSKMEKYDEEVEAINSVYDAKFKQMDKEKSAENYQSELNEKNTKKAELTNKIALLSRDTSLEGKKKLAELQSELADVNKDIADFQKDRQEELFKQQLEEQKQQQIDLLNVQKEAEQLKYDNSVENLEGKQDATNKQYDDILNDEAYWAEMKKSFEGGDFSGIQSEINGMKLNLLQMSKGSFDGISQDFAGFADSVKKEIAELSKLDVSNMVYSFKGAFDDMNDIAKAPAVSMTSGKVGSSGVSSTVETSTPAKTTPAPSTGGTKTPPKETQKRYYTVKGGDTLWDIAKAYYGNALKWTTIAQANGIPDQRKLQIGHKLLIPFRSGGYTGDWSGDDGRLAVLHKKELVLNERQTSDILNVAKIMDKVKSIIPNVKRNSVVDKLATAGTIISNSYGDIHVHVENGDKKKGKEIAKELLDGLKKKGR